MLERNEVRKDPAVSDLKDQEFVEYVVKAIVDQPEDVKAERTVDEMGVLITLKVNPQDLGQVIGRQGQTAKSIRTLLRVVGAKNHARVNLKIYEPEGYRKSHGEMPGAMHRDAPPAAPVDDVGMPPVDDLKL